MAKNKDLELRVVAKNLASKTLREVINDLKKFTSSTSGAMGGIKTAFTGIGGVFTKIGSGLRGVGSASYSVFSGMVSGAGRVFDAIFSVKTLIMGLFAGIIGKGIGAFIGLNAEFERMKVTLDVLTKGEGEAWFNNLNQWALDMPISMQEVSKAFITMQAYGLTPSIKLMEQLVDVASVLPESGRAITGIARAIGQIQAKTRLEGQELRQLAEWAVPGYEAVYTKIFKKISERTGKAVSELKFTMIDSSTAIKAILETMEEHFGGTAKRIATTWGGLSIRLTNYVKEFFRQIGEGGGMQPFKDQLENIINLFERAFKSGEMQKATSFIGSSFGIIFENIIKYFQSSKMDIKNWGDIFIFVLEKIIYAVTILANTLSGIKFVLLLLKFTWVGVALVLNSGLYGIVWLIDKVVQGFNWAIKLIDSIPGIDIVDKETFANLADFTSGLAEAQGQNLHQLGLIAYETSIDIANTADTMTNRWGAANKVVTELRANLAKYKITEAVPPPKPTVGGGGEFKETPLKPQILTEEEVNKHKKAMEAFRKENIAWMLENGSLWTQLGLSLDLYLEDLEKNKLKQASAIFKDFFNSISSTFQTAFSSMLKGTMSFSEGIQSIFEGIRDSFLDMVSTMVFEYIKGESLMALKHTFFEEATTEVTLQEAAKRIAIKSWETIKSVAIEAWGTIKIIAMKAYEAAAKVFAALAGLGPWGIILGAAGAAAAIAIVMGFASKISSFEKGTGLGGVKEDGPAMLHAGEIVLNKKESDAFRAGASSGGEASANNNTYNFNITAMDGEDMERVVRKKIIPLLQNNIRDKGRMRTAVKEAG